MLLAGSLILLIASCADDPERHELTPDVHSLVLFADQTSCSFGFHTYDSWTVTPDVDWISVYGDSHLDIAYDFRNIYHSTVSFITKPNATGKTRIGTVTVKSHYTMAVPFYQIGMLDVWHPAYTVDTWLDERSRIPDVAHYELTDSAHVEEDSICFAAHGDWTLDVVGEKPEWFMFNGKTAGSSGRNQVKFDLVQNTDTENERTVKLCLTSGKISNEIIVRQLPAKKEKEDEKGDE